MRETIAQATLPEHLTPVLLREFMDDIPLDTPTLAILLSAYSFNSVVDYYECAVSVIHKIEDIATASNELRSTAKAVAHRLFELTADPRLNYQYKVAALGATSPPKQAPNYSTGLTIKQVLVEVDEWAVASVLHGWSPMLTNSAPPHIQTLLVDQLQIVTRSPKRDETFPRFEKYFVNAAHLNLISGLKKSYERRSKPAFFDAAFVKGFGTTEATIGTFFESTEESTPILWTEYLKSCETLNPVNATDTAQGQLKLTPTLSDAERLLLSEQLRKIVRAFPASKIADLLQVVTGVIIWHSTLFREIDTSLLEEHIFANLSLWRGSIGAAIFVHRHIQMTANQRLDSKLQLLVKWLLEGGTATRSPLSSTDLNANAELIYFLREVCGQKNLTLLASVEKSSDRRRQRMAICRQLIDLDSTKVSTYEEEIKELTLDDLKEEGLHTFDQSRVFVNVAGLLVVARIEFTEAFERFCDLSAIPEGETSPPVAVLRDLVPTNKDGKEVMALQRSMSEVKQIFLDMLHGLADGYLSNPTHGLDSFLSLRIRHGSMASSIRGPLEEAQLITSHGKSSEVEDYEINDYWLSELCADGNKYESSDQLLREFSRDADRLINSAIAQYVQIFGPEHPNGVFKISLSEDVIATLSVQGRSFSSPQDFFEFCFKTFAFALDPCLENMRGIIEQQIKTPLDALLTQLALDISNVVGSQSSASFTHIVNQTRITVQQAVDRVIGWFQLRDSIDSTRTYTIEELVEVCVAIARNTHTGFSPNVTSSISDSDRKLRVMSHMMHPFSDAVFIMIDNVYRHSGLSTPPDIQLTIKLCDAQALQIRCDSPVAPDSPDRKDAEIKIARIRERVSNLTLGSSANLEGGTGLLKLRKLADGVVLNDGNRAVDFGFVGDDLFSVTVHLPVEVRSKREV